MEIFDLPATCLNLQAILQSALPYSIALVYRTQHPNRSKYAKIFTTFPPSTGIDSIPKCWAVAYFDRSMRPETELWIFAAGELPGHNEIGFCSGCKKAVLSLLKHLAGVPIPPLRPDNQYAMDMAYQHEKDYPKPQANGTYPPSPGTYMRHMLSTEVVLLGSCHENVVQTYRDYGLVRREFLRSDADLNKFIFKISDLPKTRNLPKGLRWGEMREQDLDLVRSRTSIPRTPKTLLSLKSVGVFEEATDTAVAWTYLGLDGSLTTLHTEEQYRGKGIAKAVAARIITEHALGIAVDQAGNAWSHADVYAGNIQSEAVCRSLGGKALWKDYWVKIDLGKARALVE